MMAGIIFSIIAGAAMSFQGVFNTRLSEKIGLFESNVFVQGTAFVLSLIALLVAGNVSGGAGWSGFGEATLVSRLGGVLGIVITVTVMLGIKELSPTVAISVILISQLLVAAAIDAFGWFGQEQTPFGWTKYLATAMMVGGVLLFKWK